MDIALNGHEARVFGVLVEKAFTTPDQYPLSINATTNGCNQKSNRDPVVDFSEAEVRIALQGLRMKGLAGQSVPAGTRVEKWRHNGLEILKVNGLELAILTELLLRGGQTASELKARSKRMKDAGPEGLGPSLESLTGRGLIGSVSEGRATRYAQRLCDQLHPDGPAAAFPTRDPRPQAATTAPAGDAVPPPSPATDVAAAPSRVDELERRVEALEETVARLVRELGA